MLGTESLLSHVYSHCLSFGSTASCSMYNINIIIIIVLKLRSPNLNSQNSHDRANEFNLQLAVALK